MADTYWDVRVLMECPQDQDELEAHLDKISAAFMLVPPHMDEPRAKAWGVVLTQLLHEGRYIVSIEATIAAAEAATATTNVGDAIRAALGVEQAGIFEYHAHRIGHT